MATHIVLGLIPSEMPHPPGANLHITEIAVHAQLRPIILLIRPMSRKVPIMMLPRSHIKRILTVSFSQKGTEY